MEKEHETHEMHHRHAVRKAHVSSYWKTAAIVLGIVLLISLYYNVRSDTLGREIATRNALSVVNNNLLQGKTPAKMVSSAEESGMYKMTLQIEGEEVDAFVSKDGRYLLTGAIDLESTPTVAAAPKSEDVAVDIDMESLMDDDAVRGNPDAPVTIVEFSDFECPFCGRFYSQTYGQIKKAYIETGQVKYVFRDYPLGFHKSAQKAAEAAECAGEQDKYWEMHDKLFENQDDLSIKDLKKYAREIGLVGTQFDACLDSGKYHDEVQKDLADGTAAGVTGTPAFFINGKKLTGAQPFSAFAQVIAAELEAKGSVKEIAE